MAVFPVCKKNGDALREVAIPTDGARAFMLGACISPATQLIATRVESENFMFVAGYSEKV